jgi:hypothetical protein
LIPRRTALLLGGTTRSGCGASGGRTRSRSSSAGRRRCGGSGSRGSRGGSRFGGGFDFFRVTRRRHHRDQRDVAARDHAHAFWQLDVAQVPRMVDVETRNIDLDSGRNGVRPAAHFDAVGDDRHGAAALDARRLIGVAHMDRNVDANSRALAEPHEVHMQRQIAHSVELEIARNDAMLHAIDVNVVHRRQEVAGKDPLAQLVVVEGDRQRRLAIAIDNSGYAAGATFCPGGPLAATRTRHRLDHSDGRH